MDRFRSIWTAGTPQNGNFGSEVPGRSESCLDQLSYLLGSGKHPPTVVCWTEALICKKFSESAQCHLSTTTKKASQNTTKNAKMSPKTCSDDTSLFRTRFHLMETFSRSPKKNSQQSTYADLICSFFANKNSHRRARERLLAQRTKFSTVDHGGL